MVHQDYFTHFEQNQSVGGAKMGDPQEKPPDHRKQNLACLIIPFQKQAKRCLEFVSKHFR